MSYDGRAKRIELNSKYGNIETRQSGVKYFKEDTLTSSKSSAENFCQGPTERLNKLIGPSLVRESQFVRC